jgi:hypothetical protein
MSLYLDEADVSQIERWIDTNEIAAMRADPTWRLSSGTDAGAGHELLVRNFLSGQRHTLRLRGNNDQTFRRPDFKRGDFTPLWQAQLSSEWFAELDEVWTSKWFAGLGRHNQILRPHNATLLLRVTARDLTMAFNRSADHSASETIEFPSPLGGVERVHESAYFSKDLAPVLYRLAKAKLVGPVTMSGNEHVLVFRYTMRSGSFEIAVPTLDASEKHRQTALFCLVGEQGNDDRSNG